MTSVKRPAEWRDTRHSKVRRGLNYHPFGGVGSSFSALPTVHPAGLVLMAPQPQPKKHKSQKCAGCRCVGCHITKFNIKTQSQSMQNCTLKLLQDPSAWSNVK